MKLAFTLKKAGLLGIGFLGAHLLMGEVVYEADFELDTAGMQPSGDWTFSPSSNTGTNGAVIVDSGTSPANPLPGKSMYLYDQDGDGSSGTSTHARIEINGGENLSAARVSFDFQRMYEDSNTDTRVHFTIGQAGLPMNNSDFRLFELRIQNNGDLRVESSTDGAGGGRGSSVVGSYDTANANTAVIFINTHGTEAVDYDDGTLGGTLAPNMMDLYVNGSFISSFLTLKTPDPQNAGHIDFWSSDADLGQIAFYQDSKRQGGVVFDNIVIENIGGSGPGDGGEPVVFAELIDFESDTLGAQPVIPFPTKFSPSSNTATNGFAVIDESTIEVNPMATGKALYAYDFDGNLSTGTSSHMRFDFAPLNTDNVRVDFDFQRMYETAGGLEGDSDTRMQIAVAPAGLETNNSDFRPFEIRILNNGTIVVNYNPSGAVEGGRESFEVASYNVTGANRMTFFANGNNLDGLPYDDDVLGAGTVPANTMTLFLNEVKVGEYGFINTPDPTNAPAIKFFETTDEIGRLGIYQDSKRQGGIVFDNISIREFGKLAAPLAPTSLTAVTKGSDQIDLSWLDNSENETGFIIEVLVDSEWTELALVDANSTSYEATGLEPLTEYTFRVKSTNGTPSEPSNEVAATTDMLLVPVIQIHPEDVLVATGQTAMLSVQAVGPGTLEYQWYIGESGDVSQPVAGEESTTLTTDALSMTTKYWVRVTNINGAADSNTATVNVYVPRTIRIVSISQLHALLPDALPGDTYVIDNGTYVDEHINIQAMGSEGALITVRAETPGQVILTGDSYLRVGGDWIVVEGLVFTDGWNQSLDQAISFRTSNRQATNSRVTQCAIIDYSPPSPSTDTDWIGIYGSNNRFDHNLLSGHSNKGVTLVVWRVPGKIDNHQIDHNHFRNRGDGGGDNGWETIRIGTSGDSLSASRCLVEYNLFEACDGEVEIISNKSGENVYRYNTFWRSQGMLTLRHGNDCLVDGNVFLGEGVSNTGGIRVIGENHTVVNNYIERTMGRHEGAIAIYAGVPNSPLNRYYTAHNAYVAHNTIVDVPEAYILVGAGYGSSDRTELPTGVSVVNNLFAQVNTSGSSTDGPGIGGEAVVNPTYEGNIASGVSVGIDLSGTSETSVPFELGDFGLWRPESGSAVVDAAVSSSLQLDMDGQSRDLSPDVGADEIVDADGLNIGGPLHPLELGPDWREWVDTVPPWIGPALRHGLVVDSVWLGQFSIGNENWVYKLGVGWMFVDAISTTEDMWFYLPETQSWIWSSRTAFPYGYDPATASWVYYQYDDGKVHLNAGSGWILVP